MNFMIFFTLFAIALPLLLLLDLIWLRVIARSLYQNRLQGLRENINWPTTIIFYAVFVIGLTFFASYPTATRGTIYTGLVLGTLYGLFTFAAYSLRNVMTCRGRSVLVTMTDIVWGACLAAAVTTMTFYIYSNILN